jgi:L-asparaginase II
MSSANPVLVEATRGGIVESFHRGAYAVLDADGTLRASAGDIERPVFPRSAVKLLQALPLVESGAADALGLSNEELALACASHGGEPGHASTAAAMLAKAGVDDTALECGSHWPYQDEATRAMAALGGKPSALHNNCSGKHAGFVCLACGLHGGARGSALRGFLRGYVQPDHPVMREVTASLQSCTGYNLDGAVAGVDGCGIPTYAVPLRHLAHAFARVASGTGLRPAQAAAARRLRQAIAAAPWMVAGSGAFDTLAMQALGEQVCMKVGAEGVYCAALPELGYGIALKMDDGNNARAAEVAIAALLLKLLPGLGDEQAAPLRERVALPLRNRNGAEVGRLRAASALAVAGG